MSKGNRVKEHEAGIQSMFETKQKTSMRDAFDRFIPFGATSVELRKTLTILGENGLLPNDERATKSIIELSNVIQPFLYHLNDEQYELLNDRFAKTINHIVRLESSIVHPPPAPAKVEPPPPQLELEVILSNNDVLRKHIETVEHQINCVKDSKRKLIEANQEHVAQIEKQNAQLRINLQSAKSECEQYYQQYLQKEKELQTVLIQLSGAQEELKRVKFEYNEKALNAKNTSTMESFQRNSKYSAKEFVKLNAIIDAMRLELTKERLDRAGERETLKANLISAENKLNYSEVIINELREQLKNVSIAQYQETGEFNKSLHTLASFQPHNLDIDYLHASTVTSSHHHNITQNHSNNNPNNNTSLNTSGSASKAHHPYTPSVLRHGLSKNLLVQSPVHTLPRGHNYIVVNDGTSPTKSFRYKSPFVVKNLDHSLPAGTPPLYEVQHNAKRRSQSAHSQRQVAYAHMTTPGSGRSGRSQSTGRSIRSLRGVPMDVLKSMAATHPADHSRQHQQLPHHLIDTSHYLHQDHSMNGSTSIADKIDLSTWNHPMYRSLQATGFTSAPHSIDSADVTTGAPVNHDEADNHSIPHSIERSDHHHHEENKHNTPHSISRILSSTVDQHSVEESEESEESSQPLHTEELRAVDEYVTDDMLNDQANNNHSNNGNHEQEHVHHGIEPESPSAHELRNMTTSPQRLSHANSFSGRESATHSPLTNDKRSASLHQMPSTQFDPSKYRNSATSPVPIKSENAHHSSHPSSSRHLNEQATSPIQELRYPEELSRMSPSPQGLPHSRSFVHQSTSPVPHGALSPDKRSSSMSRLNAQQFDPATFQQSVATSPIPLSPEQVGHTTSPMEKYADELQHMSPTPDKIQKSLSFRDQVDSHPSLSNDKRSSSMHQHPSQQFDPSLYQQKPSTHDTEYEGHPSTYSDELKNMSLSPSQQIHGNRAQSFNHQSSSGGLQAPLTGDKRSSSMTKVSAVTRVDSSIKQSGNKVKSSPMGLGSRGYSMATFSSIPEVEEVDDSEDNNNNEDDRDRGRDRGCSDDLSTITPVAQVEDIKIPVTPPQSAVSSHHQQHQMEGHMLNSLYDEIQHLKQSHFSPHTVKSSARRNTGLPPKASPFHRSGDHSIKDSAELLSMHEENLHAIQGVMETPTFSHTHKDVNAVKFEELLKEYNEVLSLYVNEMRKSRSMQIDYRSEIHDSARSVSEFEEHVSGLNHEKLVLQQQIEEMKNVLYQKEIQHSKQIANVEHKCSALESENKSVIDDLNKLEREVHTLRLTEAATATSTAEAVSPVKIHRNPLTSHIESCMVQLKLHKNDREIGKVMELLKAELSAVFATETNTTEASTPMTFSSSSKHSNSFRSVKSITETVAELSVEVTLAALRNLLQWIEHTLASSVFEINTKVRENEELKDRIETQENIINDQSNLLDNKEQLIQESRMRILELERRKTQQIQQQHQQQSSVESNQIHSLKSQLEQTYLELEEAKKRHNASNANLSIAMPSDNNFTNAPKGSHSPSAVSRRSHTSVAQQHDAISSAYSGRHSPRHSPIRVRGSNSLPAAAATSIDEGFVSSPDELEHRSSHHQQHYHNLHTSSAHSHTDINSTRFREGLMSGNVHLTPDVPHTGTPSSVLRHSYDSNTRHQLHQSQQMSGSMKSELEKRALAAEMKCELLANQIKATPSSLSVANAEKRVMECKLNKATLNFEVTIKQMEADALHKISEFKTFLQLERAEKEALQNKIKDQAATIHQLTHHLKVIHAAKNVPEMTSTSATFTYNAGAIHVEVPPPPWEHGVESDAGSVTSQFSRGNHSEFGNQSLHSGQIRGSSGAHHQQQHPQHQHQQSYARNSNNNSQYASTVGHESPNRSRSSPQRVRRY